MQNLHTTPTLPEASGYSPARSIIDPWMSGKRTVDVAWNVEVYAEMFVENMLSKRLKARYWSAVNSTAVWAGGEDFMRRGCMGEFKVLDPHIPSTVYLQLCVN
jgi:hypothetical protein